MTDITKSPDPRRAMFWHTVFSCEQVLLRRALSLTRDPTAAEDLVQDTLLKAVVSYDQFELGTNLQAWLFTIMRNRFLTGRRKAGREVELDPEWAKAIPDENTGPSLEDDDTLAYDFEVVVHCLAALRDDMSNTLILCHYAELKYAAAAVELNVAEGTIKSRVNRAIAQVTQQLASTEIQPSNVELWLSQKILHAHAAGQTKLAKACEMMFVRYHSLRKRVAETPVEGSELSEGIVVLGEVDHDIASLFDDF